MRKLDWVVVVLLATGASIGVSALVAAQPPPAPVITTYDVAIARLEEQQKESNRKLDQMFYMLLASLGVHGAQLGGAVRKRQGHP